MYDNKYILGLDIGISSVGWGMLELDNNNLPYRIIDLGSRIFTPGEVEKTGDSRAKEREKNLQKEALEESPEEENSELLE